MKLKNALSPLALFTASVVIALLLSELGARLILKPSNYLQVEMIEDKVLGRVPSIASRAHGFDAWGFRNPEVPKTVDIVAIGDSHTYGNTATMEDSWPYVLSQLSGRSVYDLAMGGYGPNQYYYLFKTKALSLKPSMIICGLYMGDDFENAFLITYGLNYWAYLRELPPAKVNFDIWEAPPPPSLNKKIRLWLSRNSVIYQLVFHGPIFGSEQGEFQIKHASTIYPGEGTSLVIPEKHIEEAFLPKGILRRLDQSSESVREGMRITFKLLSEMDKTCRENNIQFIVAVIPAKEMVFADYLEHNPSLPLHEVFDKLLPNAQLANEKTFKFLTDAGIRYVDTLPALREAREHQLYARTATDTHPNKNGYRVIGQAIFDALREGGHQ